MYFASLTQLESTNVRTLYFTGSSIAGNGDVIIVVIQYRLGAFGFLYTQERTPSNLGLWDQRLALQWIQNNIIAFGGDKQKVTLFGESAGSIAISCHMVSSVSAGIFVFGK